MGPARPIPGDRSGELVGGAAVVHASVENEGCRRGSQGRQAGWLSTYCSYIRAVHLVCLGLFPQWLWYRRVWPFFFPRLPCLPYVCIIQYTEPVLRLQTAVCVCLMCVCVCVLSGRDFCQLVQDWGLPRSRHREGHHVHLPPSHQREGKQVACIQLSQRTRRTERGTYIPVP